MICADTKALPASQVVWTQRERPPSLRDHPSPLDPPPHFLFRSPSVKGRRAAEGVAGSVGRSVGCKTQMPLVRSVMTLAFTSLRRNSFSLAMLCVHDCRGTTRAKRRRNGEEKQSTDWSLKETIQFILYCTKRKVFTLYKFQFIF